MKSDDTWFKGYGESHQDRTNKIVYWASAPAIMFSFVGLIGSILSPAATALALIQSAGERTFATLDRDVTAMRSDGAGRVLAVVTGEPPFPGQKLKPSDLWLFDGRTGSKLGSYPLKGWMQALAFSSDGSLLAYGGEGVEVWDTRARRRLFRIDRPSGVKGLAFAPSGRHLAIANVDGKLKLVNARTGAGLREMTVCKDIAFAVAYSPRGDRILTGGDYDGRLDIWDAKTGKHIRKLNAHSSSIDSIAYSPDGTRFVTGSWDNTATVWDARSGRPVLTLRGHGNVWSVAYSPDGMRIATASAELDLWDAKTGRKLLNAPDYGMNVAFLDGSKKIASDRKNRVLTWPVPAQNH